MQFNLATMFRYAVVIIGLYGCRKTAVDAPIIDITTTKTTYKMGEPVQFLFAGDPDDITFYSGEDGRQYQYRDRILVTGKPELQFSSWQQLTGTQTNTLAVMVSTDFKGVYDTVNVKNATWTDITSKATLSVGSDNTPSGKIDLSEFNKDNKPMFIAFKFRGDAGTRQKTWLIRSFDLNNILPDGKSLVVTNLANGGWKPVDFLDFATTWKYVSATQLSIAPSATQLIGSNDWAITKPLYVNKVSPDVGIALKHYAQKLSSYTYTFPKAGTYVVTFVIANATIYDQKEITKQITITVTP